MSEPLTLEDIAALPVGARVWWLSGGARYTTERIAPDLWCGVGDFDFAEFDDVEMACGAPVYLDEPEVENAPGDSAGTQEPGATTEDVARLAEGWGWLPIEPGPCCDGCGYGDRLDWMFVIHPEPGPDEGGDSGSYYDDDDIDGTPDTLPAVDACAS
jgi:hypothetical protein